MRSYLEIIKELQETVNTDTIPYDDKVKIDKKIQELMDMLWVYSY